MSRREVADRLVVGTVLVLVWMLLWASTSPAVVLSGVVVAVGALVSARLPPLPMVAYPRLSRLPAALGSLAVDLVRSSAVITWAALRHGPRTRSAVVAVPVPPAHDVVLAAACTRISLTPDSLVLEIDRDADVLYVYVLPVRDVEAAERARRQVAATVRQVVALLGQDPDGSRR